MIIDDGPLTPEEEALVSSATVALIKSILLYPQLAELGVTLKKTDDGLRVELYVGAGTQKGELNEVGIAGRVESPDGAVLTEENEGGVELAISSLLLRLGSFLRKKLQDGGIERLASGEQLHEESQEWVLENENEIDPALH